jgi:ADP-heptose:LPS heptosyltransferase
MSKKQKQKQKLQNIAVKKNVIKQPYAFFKVNETAQLSSEFNKLIIIKGDDVLAPVNYFKESLFSFRCSLEKILNPLTANINLNNKKLLIIRYGGIGDVISSMFAIAELKNKYPTVKIGYLTNFKNLDILRIFPNLIDYVSQPIAKLETIRRFDYVVCLDNVIELDDESTNAPIQDIYAKHLFSNITLNSLDMVFNNNIINQKTISKGIGIQYITNSVIRNYNIDNIICLINLLTAKFPNEPICLLGPPNDYLNVEYILSKINSQNIIVNGCGSKELNILETIKLVNTLKLVIGPDSSMLHIAGICNVPAIGLFGSFPSDLRMSYYNKMIGIDGKSDCSPCFRHNPQAFCKLNNGQGVCLNSISPQLIIDNIPEILI